ncbi:MAG: fibronectin type III domain-containing protein, partial [Nitrospirae bacterium]|nr:fibronectin type III domain-containing protein [Nitrospirota bacterium]
MKKFLIMLFLTALVANNMSCGSGGSSSNTPGKTMVTLTLGQQKAVAFSGPQPRGTASSIPSSVVEVIITISAPDMDTIQEIIPVSSGQTSLSVTIDVPNGLNRHFVIEGRDAAGNVLFRGETYADLNGSPITLSIPMIPTSTVAPVVFSGISSIGSITSTSLVLTWSPASGGISMPGNMQYLIYMSTTPGGENFAAPSFTTLPGATSFTVSGLNPGVTYYFVIRAQDEAGNKDTNTIEKSAT